MKSLLKHLSIVAVLFGWFAPTVVVGQSLRSEIEILQDAFGLEKKAAVADFMELGDDAGAFWALYDAYEAERAQLANQRIDVIQAYAQNFETLSEEKILVLKDKTSEVKQSFDKLQDKYFKLMSKEIGVYKAAQFWQLETYFSVLVQANLFARLPFIGEKLNEK